MVLEADASILSIAFPAPDELYALFPAAGVQIIPANPTMSAVAVYPTIDWEPLKVTSWSMVIGCVNTGASLVV